MYPGTTPDAVQHSGPPRRLAICVDDFGLSAAVDDSVFELASQGRISATSCLVDGPNWRADAPRLRATLAGQIDIGLHLNLSETFPGRQAHAGWTQLVWRACARRLDRRQVQAEIDRQMDTFHAAMHAEPDFVDGHRHVHQLPVVREALLKSLAQRGWRPWLRCTLPAPRVHRPLRERFKAQVIGRLGGHTWQKLARRHGYAMNGHLLGVYGFCGSAEEHAARLAAWLQGASDGDLLMCHTALPGSPADADPLRTARELEHSLLAGPAFARLLALQAIRVQRLPRAAS